MDSFEQKPIKEQQIISTGSWIITFLILMIPFVNLIMLFIWALSDDTPPTKSNFATAALMMIPISFGIGFLLSFILKDFVSLLY